MPDRGTAGLWFSVAAMVVLLAIATPAQVAQYFVDQGHPLADDDNSGGEALPWLTVGKAAATAAAGDTVTIKAGVYVETVTIANSGNAGDAIVFQAHPGDTVVLDGSANPGWYGVISLYGNDHVVLDGLEITGNSTGWGVLVEHTQDDPANSASHIELRDLAVHHTGGEAIQVRGHAHDVLIADCVVHDAQYPSGIDIYQWGGGRPHHVTVRGCTA